MTDLKNYPHQFLREDVLRETIELLYFSYRDFTEIADKILLQYGYGRAHHRVLYFVARYPNRSVSDLLSLLKITKQSLSRVLSELVAQEFIIHHHEPRDKRIKLLSLTQKGQALEQELYLAQKKMIEASFARTNAQAVKDFRQILLGLIQDPEHARLFTQENKPASA